MFVRACSGWSLGCGAVRPDALLDWAERAGLKSICQADFDNLYGTIDFYEQARMKGIRPILAAIVTEPTPGEMAARDALRRQAARQRQESAARGCRPAGDDNRTGAGGPAYDAGMTGCAHGEDPPAVEVDDAAIGQTKIVVRRFDAPQAVAVACSRAGYENLCRLLTARQMAERFDLARSAGEHQEGLVFLVRDPQVLRRLARTVGPAALYAEVLAPSTEAERRQNYRLMVEAERLGVPPIASHFACFERGRDWNLHRVLRAVVLNRPADWVPSAQLAAQGAWLQPLDRLAARLAGQDLALRNAAVLEDRCGVDLELGVAHFPKVPLAPGETSIARLARLVEAGLARRYRPMPSAARPRIRHELQIIDKLGFADYFLVVHEIVGFARRKGIDCVGRGSAADSLVTYCLGISEVDPLRYELHFERFLNESRTDWPDIDLDFDWRRRDEVIRFVYERWGASHTAMITTQHFYRARSAFRDAARALGMPPERLNALTGRLPYDEPENLRAAIRSMPECRDFPVDDPQVAQAIAIAERLAKLPRGLSVHVGGVVIADRPITCYTPLQPATKGIAVTQYDMRAIERVGLVKIDLLGHRSLAIVADTLEMVRRNHGVKVDLRAVPEDDEAVAKALAAGRTIGCFQIESPGMRQLLQMLRARDLLDVIHALSLIRPGPSASGMKEHFVKRKLGLEAVTHLHPAMAEVLADTFGVMLYQEDVMRVAAAVAGFTMATGDQLRKALEKPGRQEYLDGLKEKFMAGAGRRGCDAPTAELIWQLVSNFAAYSYNKAHACTYGRIAYECAYLKTHWKAEFLTAVLNNVGGYYSISEYLEEARRLRVPILPPNVNASEGGFSAEPIAVQPVLARRRDGQERPGVRGSGSGREPGLETRDSGIGNNYDHGHGVTLRRVGIRVGLQQVKGLSERAVEAIVEQRRRRPFAGLEDLLGRVRLSSDEVRALILSGACDGLGPSRPALLWQMALWRQRAADRRRPAQETLFPQGAKAGLRRIDGGAKQNATERAGEPGEAGLPEHLLQNVDRRRLLELERQYLSLTASDHAMAGWDDALTGQDRVRTVDLPGLIGRVVTVAGVVAATRRAATREGELMEFVTIEDRWGLVEVVLFPDVYRRIGGLFRSFGPYLVRGLVQDNLGAVVLVCRSARRVEDGPGEAGPPSLDDIGKQTRRLEG